MKISINSVKLLGNVVDDPVYESADKQKAAILFIMTNKLGRDQDGKLIQHPQINRVFLYNTLETFVRETIKKGDYVFISGELETRYWIDNNNNEQSFTVVVAKKISVEEDSPDTTEKEHPAGNKTQRKNTTKVKAKSKGKQAAKAKPKRKQT